MTLNEYLKDPLKEDVSTVSIFNIKCIKIVDGYFFELEFLHYKIPF